MKNKIPGIVLAVAVMLAAKFLSGFIPLVGATLLALILGIIIRQVVVKFTKFDEGVAWSEKYILEAAIVFIGFGFEVSKLNSIGTNTLLMIVFSIFLIIILALILGKIFGKDNNKLYWLLGAGSAICGSSAIAATAPLIGAKKEEIGLSLAVVNLLGLIGMIVLPIIAVALHYTNVDTGILIGGILQSVGHVVGAGFSVNEETGAFATIVKMGRIVFLIPFLLAVYFIFRKNNSRTKRKFPIFILLFVLAVLISQSGFLNSDSLKFISTSGDTLLNIGMAAIGLKINIKSLWKISGKALLAGVIIFSLQIISYVLFLSFR